MPTPLEVLLDPIPLAVLAIYGGLILLDMLACRDVAASDFQQSVRPTPPQTVRP
jgi:hypothetical protein